ncbi:MULTISPECIES: hypothetical protein [Acidithiobacillus]|jgi:hypothetical protein|uniref:hypothetical protein n=1 Tax=Acidithiobacillus TaxID=119977 RepID=UPI00094AF235|nr:MULTISPECIES: hypothetical protein [Acidithiobacillus]MDD2750740.1 hypothetical protein [Acidithiobacillus sp.]MDD5278748.1 hypothetical protein [Acidithiobacillus sp.]
MKKTPTDKTDNVVVQALEVWWLRSVKEIRRLEGMLQEARQLEAMLQEARESLNQDTEDEDPNASEKADDSSHCCVDLYRATGSSSR